MTTILSTERVPASLVAQWLSALTQLNGITPTRKYIQKLLYFAQARYLLEYGEPLFDEEIEAWKNGPVVNSVWELHIAQVEDSLDYDVRVNPDFDFSIISGKNSDFLLKLWNTYGKIPLQELEELSHELPWKEYYVKDKIRTIIPKNAILQYYLIREMLVN